MVALEVEAMVAVTEGGVSEVVTMEASGGTGGSGGGAEVAAKELMEAERRRRQVCLQTGTPHKSRWRGSGVMSVRLDRPLLAARWPGKEQ